MERDKMIHKTIKHTVDRYRLIFLFIICLCCSNKTYSQQSSLKISLDSAHLEMGRQTQLHLQLSVPKSEQGGLLLLPADTLSKFVEISYVTNADTILSDEESPATIIRQDIILQSFDSGLYTIGPIPYICANGDTILSNMLSLKVFPVDIDTLQTIHSFAPVVSPDSKWWDIIPDIILDYWAYCIIILIIVGIGITIWLIYKRKMPIPFISSTKSISPYDAAISSLDKLKDQHLCENGMEKEYYSELTEILRIYLEGRFGINAMEMTSTQILESLNNNEETRHHHLLIKRILEIADYVKFAKMRPLPSDNVTAWDNAREFVVETKPEEGPQESENNNIEEK